MSTGIASVDRLIERAAAALDAPGPPEVGLDTLGRAMNEGRLTPELLDDAGRKGSAVVEHALARAETADTTLREAATRLLAEQPARGAYAARRAVVLALRERHPRHARVVLKPEAVLTPFAGIPPCPPVGARYQHLLERPARYWSDPVYEALVLTAPADLPESAMLALCVLTRVSTQALLRGNEYGEPVTTLIARYGARFVPAALEYLGHPERYGWDASIHANVLGTRWFPSGAGQPILAAAAEWPDAQAAPLFRVAFEAGWNTIGASLPDRPWSRTLLGEFADSPYGPPAHPLWLGR
jgi:hypothetical protein